MRRTTDPQTLLTEALGLYLAWLLGAWIMDREFMARPWSLLMLAGPAATAMSAMMLGDAWTATGHRRAPLVRAVHGSSWALISQVAGYLIAPHMPLAVMILGICIAIRRRRRWVDYRRATWGDATMERSSHSGYGARCRSDSVLRHWKLDRAARLQAVGAAAQGWSTNFVAVLPRCNQE